MDLGANDQIAPYKRHRVSPLDRQRLTRGSRAVPGPGLLQLCEHSLSGAMQGVTDFTFSLVYTSIEEVLPRIESLLTVARLDDSKEGVQQAARQLAGLIQVCCQAASVLHLAYARHPLLACCPGAGCAGCLGDTKRLLRLCCMLTPSLSPTPSWDVSEVERAMPTGA